jgi:CheY-like chemotaxis protein
MVVKAPLLLVEDNPADALDLIRGLEACKCSSGVREVHDVGKARDYLLGTGVYADRQRFPFPKLLLVNVDLEQQSGFPFLRWLNSERGLNKLPVIGFIGAHDPATIKMAYDLGVNSCLVRPQNPEKWQFMMQLVCQYWLKLNQNPEI